MLIISAISIKLNQANDIITINYYNLSIFYIYSKPLTFNFDLDIFKSHVEILVHYNFWLKSKKTIFLLDNF